VDDEGRSGTLREGVAGTPGKVSRKGRVTRPDTGMAAGLTGRRRTTRNGEDMAALDSTKTRAQSQVRDGVDRETVETVESMAGKYKHGWETDIEMDFAPKGLNEDIVRLISAKNDEPEWLTNWRLDAYRRWLTMEAPGWAMIDYPEIDYQDQYYYAKPKSMAEKPKSLDDVDPKLLETYAKLGIPLKEQMILAGVEGAEAEPGRKVAVDAVFDSVSLGTTFKDELAKAGVIFCSISEAVREHPELVKKYLGSVVPQNDNYFAALNSAVFSDGSFVYIPAGTRCPMELSTYFRINAENTGQFERTLIVAEKGSYVSYLEGCTAPKRDTHQLHAAVVEIVILEDAEVKYSTVQNWYPGDEDGRGGIYNFVTKRADCREDRAKVMWTQVETGSAITWKYPSCILRGDDSQGEFYSIAIANNAQQADTGTKMIHLGKNTRSRIVSKGISAGRAQNTYRGLVTMHPKASNSRNYTQCDSLLIGDKCGAHTVPYIEVRNSSSRVEHEATTSKVDDDQLFYCRSRGMDEEEAVALVVNGFCREVLQALPMEFAMEAQSLVAISLEGSVG
jgi:Fe-S cluster assembly protein SufB